MSDVSKGIKHLYTIGHSTHPIEYFVGLLKRHGIRVLVDVRTVPKSRHVPQFNKEALDASLKEQGIGYRHFPQLGGLRKPRKDSPNLAWKTPGFRGFADHMQSERFEAAIAKLIALAQEEGPGAIMCAEALPWRCHRSLIADALVARGISVFQLDGKGHATPHTLTSFAHVKEGRVIYPAIM